MKRNSLFDQDFYQLTMAQLVFHNHRNNVEVEYKFICRNAKETGFFNYVKLDEFRSALYSYLEGLTISSLEIVYLDKLGYFQPDFLDWLAYFKFRPQEHLFFEQGWRMGWWELRIKGSWLDTIMYEIFILSFLNEWYGRFFETNIEGFEGRLEEKIKLIAENNIKNGYLKLIEFGTRRRFSYELQNEVISTLKEKLPDNLIGTSNVHFAHKFGLTPIGTHSHQLFMIYQALMPIQDSQEGAWNFWLLEYPQESLRIALTDTFGDDKFLADFKYYLDDFEGVRHDSGCPEKFARLIIEMYAYYNIDPRKKKLVFSDGLDIPTAIKLHNKFNSDIQTSFGIGTNLTFDIPGITAPQIVIKPVRANGQPVVKLSNNPSKVSCEDPVYLEYVKHAIENY